MDVFFLSEAVPYVLIHIHSYMQQHQGDPQYNCSHMVLNTEQRHWSS